MTQTQFSNPFFVIYKLSKNLEYAYPGSGIVSSDAGRRQPPHIGLRALYSIGEWRAYAAKRNEPFGFAQIVYYARTRVSP